MRNILIVLISIISLVACNKSLKGDSKEEPISDITILRFDKDLYAYLQNPTMQKRSNLIAGYPSLLPAFGQIAVGKMIDNDTVQFFNALSEYFAHPTLKKIYEDEIKQFNDLSKCENALSEADAILKQILPQKKLPRFAVHVSGFKENVIAVDSIISLSADKYLGESYSAYQQFFTPEERARMDSKLMPADYLKAWIITDNVVKVNEKSNLLSNIIEEGKTLYLLSKLLTSSGYNQEELIGYTQSEMNWCETNVKTIWKETQKNNRLLSTDRQLISRYVEEAPISKKILPNAPDRIGCWLGWKIIEEYASRTGKSVQEIIIADSQTILKESKFKP